jgi:hypothetical protein
MKFSFIGFRRWLAVWNGKSQHTFVERFRYVSGADYPDRCKVEFYLNGPGRHTQIDAAGPTPADPRVTPYYLETEIISPYISLRPGEEGSFETEWFATRSAEHIRGVTDSGVVCEPFRAHVSGSSVHSMTEQERLNKITETIISAAIQVHRVLGPGWLESAYVACLAHKLGKRGLVVEQ